MQVPVTTNVEMDAFQNTNINISIDTSDLTIGAPYSSKKISNNSTPRH